MIDFNHNSNSPKSACENINNLIDAALVIEKNAEPKRNYLGASMLGKACSRAIQYEFVGAPKDEGKEFDGQTLRIFAAGHLFEDLLIKWFKSASFDLRTVGSDGHQFGFSMAGGKISGHSDGKFVGGAACMSYPALWECKSLKNKSWTDTVKKGVALSKPIYAAQIALYQAYLNLTENPAIFSAINKDTSEIYHELVPFNAELAQRISDKAVNILKATEHGEQMPRGFSSEDHFECKMCSYKNRCWS